MGEPLPPPRSVSGRRRATWLVVWLGWLALVGPSQAADEVAAWQALSEDGWVVLMRHALAPGTGDPAGFELGDCTTQRNLSEDGRAQARAIGERFREQGVEVGAVRSSRWCRCLETARLLALGDVVPTPALDSFFRRQERAEAQTARVREMIEAWEGPGTLVLVTHQVNITALTGVYPRSGELLVLAPGEAQMTLVGRIR